MDDANGSSMSDATARWSDGPTAKQRTAVQHAVVRLLDQLAPEASLSRAERKTDAVQRYRSPRGCILQGTDGAVSVSWFPGVNTDAGYGELHVIAWRGIVSHPGSARRAEGAVAMQQLVVGPTEVAPNEWVWRAADGALYNGPALAERCEALLDDPTAAGEPVGRAD
jgi:hypothetical protein